MEIKGVIYAVMQVESGQSAKGDWKKQTIVVETENAQYPKKIAVEIWNDLTKLPYTPGASISLEADIDAREYNGKWYNSVKGYKINNNASEFLAKNEAKEQRFDSVKKQENTVEDTDLPF